MADQIHRPHVTIIHYEPSIGILFWRALEMVHSYSVEPITSSLHPNDSRYKFVERGMDMDQRAKDTARFLLRGGSDKVNNVILPPSDVVYHSLNNSPRVPYCGRNERSIRLGSPQAIGVAVYRELQKQAKDMGKSPPPFVPIASASAFEALDVKVRDEFRHGVMRTPQDATVDNIQKTTFSLLYPPKHRHVPGSQSPYKAL